jgi:predicted small lipoprotein YifL
MLLWPKFLLFSCVVLLASSCGLKGPLYRPDEPKNETVAPCARTRSRSASRISSLRLSGRVVID